MCVKWERPGTNTRSLYRYITVWETPGSLGPCSSVHSGMQQPWNNPPTTGSPSSSSTKERGERVGRERSKRRLGRGRKRSACKGGLGPWRMQYKVQLTFSITSSEVGSRTCSYMVCSSLLHIYVHCYANTCSESQALHINLSHPAHHYSDHQPTSSDTTLQTSKSQKSGCPALGINHMRTLPAKKHMRMRTTLTFATLSCMALAIFFVFKVDLLFADT